jgi:hypothetical protein
VQSAEGWKDGVLADLARTLGTLARVANVS